MGLLRANAWNLEFSPILPCWDKVGGGGFGVFLALRLGFVCWSRLRFVLSLFGCWVLPLLMAVSLAELLLSALRRGRTFFWRSKKKVRPPARGNPHVKQKTTPLVAEKKSPPNNKGNRQ